MRDLFILTAHLLTTIAKLLGTGGAKSIVADSLLTKQQLLIVRRQQRRSPKLAPVVRKYCDRIDISVFLADRTNIS